MANKTVAVRRKLPVRKAEIPKVGQTAAVSNSENTAVMDKPEKKKWFWKTKQKPVNNTLTADQNPAQPMGSVQSEKTSTAEIYSSEEDVKYFSVKKILQVLLSKWLVLTCAGLSVLLASSLYFYFQNDSEAGVVLSLNYEQSTKGQNPNDTRFSISEIRSEPVVTKAIEYAGMEGIIDPALLTECISVSTYTNRGYNYEESYIATSFYISLNGEYWELAGRNRNCPPSQMIKLLIQAYKDVFFEKYTSHAEIFGGVSIDYEEMEYIDIVSYFNLQLDRIETFLQELINEDIAFTSAEKGLTFQQLMEMLNNITDISYADLKSYVWENGLAKDPVLTVNTLKYQNWNLEKKYYAAMDEHDIRTKIIEEYQRTMIDSVLIPSYDDKGEYYMARTKTGVDELAKEAEAYLSEANEYRTEIDENTDMLTKIEAAAGTGSTARAQRMIDSLDQQIQELEQLSVEMKQEYQNQLTHNYISYQTINPGVLRKLNVKAGIALAMLVCFILLAAFYREEGKKDWVQN